MSGKRTGIALVGTGVVAHMHARGIEAVSHAQIQGVCDEDHAKAQAFALQYGCKVYASFDAILADPKVEAVFVLTPEKTHVNLARQAMEAGKHVLVEKPVAQTADEIDVLSRTAERYNRVCFPGHNYIYTPSVQRAKRLIDRGAFGRVTSMWILYNLFHPEEVAKNYEGVLREVMIHHFYSLLYLLGRPVGVSAFDSCLHYKELTREDQCMVVATMPDGAIANLWTSFAASDPTNDPWTVTYKVLGTKGGVNYSWNDACFEDQGGPAWGIINYVESFTEQADFFINRCVRSGHPALSTLDDAKLALVMTEAAEASLRTNHAMVRPAWNPADDVRACRVDEEQDLAVRP